MKLFILGHRGWIGQKYVDYCRKNDIAYCFSDTRADDAKIEKVILESKATYLVPQYENAWSPIFRLRSFFFFFSFFV